MNKAGYRDAALAAKPGDLVIVIIRRRADEKRILCPTLWEVRALEAEPRHDNTAGWLRLRRTGTLVPD